MDLEKIKKLIEFVGSSRVSELAVTENGVTVRILNDNGQPAPRQQAVSSASVAPAVMETAAAAPVTNTPAPQSKTITAPSFGLFHRAPSPGAPAFVDVGSEIVEGQELFIIEAMKVFNTVKADRSGKVVKFLITDGEDVELGQPVLELE